MKLKFMPILGLATIASTLPLTVSCGKSKYEKTVDLSEIINGYKRTTEYCKILPNDPYTDYARAIKKDHNIFIDDIFETISDSTYWDLGSKLEGKLGLKLNDVSEEEVITSEQRVLVNVISANAKLDNVILKLHAPKSDYKIKEISFNGTIKVTNLPFYVDWDSYPEGRIYKMVVLLEALKYVEDWEISINGHASITTEIESKTEVTEGDIEQAFNHEKFEEATILEKFAFLTLLGYVKYDLPYYNKGEK